MTAASKPFEEMSEAERKAWDDAWFERMLAGQQETKAKLRYLEELMRKSDSFRKSEENVRSGKSKRKKQQLAAGTKFVNTDEMQKPKNNDDKPITFKMFNEFRNEMNSKFMSLEGKLDSILKEFRGEFVKIDARFDSVDARFAEVNGEFLKVSSEISMVRSDIAKVEAGIHRVHFLSEEQKQDNYKAMDLMAVIYERQTHIDKRLEEIDK